MAEYNTAVRKGARLAKKLGKGWKSKVWENLGWHYSAEKGHMNVSSGPNYFCNLISKEFSQVYASAQKPDLAVRRMLAEARKQAKAILLACDEVSK